MFHAPHHEQQLLLGRAHNVHELNAELWSEGHGHLEGTESVEARHSEPELVLHCQIIVLKGLVCMPVHNLTIDIDIFKIVWFKTNACTIQEYIGLLASV